MSRFKAFLLLAVLFSTVLTSVVSAGALYRRQYYGGWNYHRTNRYYYRSYYYKPYVSYPKYKYHYCVHYPSRPRYVYYYNPYRKTYWGRYDLEQSGYSLLAKEDRKGKLEDIPESAFPEPGKMPVIPTDDEDIPSGQEDKQEVRIDPFPKDDLPKEEAPKDTP